MSDVTVMYHGGGCLDGFTAAWVMRRHFPDAEFYAVNYHELPPCYPTGHLYLVDFLFQDRAVMHDLIEAAERVTIFDHHAGSEQLFHELMRQYPNKVSGNFDRSRSGAGITWDVMEKHRARPELVDLVEDRDLWWFRKMQTKAYTAGLATIPLTWEKWNWAHDNYILVCVRGQAELDRIDLEVQDHLKTKRFTLTLPEEGGREVPAIMTNVPELRSELADALLKDTQTNLAGVCWFTEKGLRVRLVSTPDGPDVNVICKRHGGGGHAHAAGFLMTPDIPA